MSRPVDGDVGGAFYRRGMWIDCSKCPQVDSGCHGCVVSYLTGGETDDIPSGAPPRREIRALTDTSQRRAIEALVAGGLVSPEAVVEVRAG